MLYISAPSLLGCLRPWIVGVAPVRVASRKTSLYTSLSLQTLWLPRMRVRLLWGDGWTIGFLRAVARTRVRALRALPPPYGRAVLKRLHCTSRQASVAARASTMASSGLPRKPMTDLYEAIRRFLEHGQDEEVGKSEFDMQIAQFVERSPGDGEWRPHPLNYHPPNTHDSLQRAQRMIKVSTSCDAHACRLHVHHQAPRYTGFRVCIRGRWRCWATSCTLSQRISSGWRRRFVSWQRSCSSTTSTACTSSAPSTTR
jgi:hypothetical protein